MTSSASAKSYSELEETLGHKFQTPGLFQTALTHSSSGHAKNYERLEFLGDRVLGLIIAELLYESFPQETEGDMAKRLAALVQGSILARLAQQIDLGAYIVFSNAEKQAGGAENENILADVFEALLGALYLDGGFEVCANFLKDLYRDRLYDMKTPPLHPKTAVQEWAQGKGLPLPSYEITGQSGPDHAPVFEVTLSLEGFDPVCAQGRSRQAAEKLAATMLYEHIQEKNGS